MRYWISIPINKFKAPPETYTKKEILIGLWTHYSRPFRVKLYYPVLYWLAVHFPSVFRLKQADIIDPPHKED